MDKEHLIDLISNSMICEMKDLETYKNKFNAENYLNKSKFKSVANNFQRIYFVVHVIVIKSQV